LKKKAPNHVHDLDNNSTKRNFRAGTHSNFGEEVSSENLYNQLKESYSDKNLNKITSLLVELYKSREFGKIKEITSLVSEYVEIKNEKINKCFSQLMMLYHPDKGAFYRKEIEKAYSTGTIDNLTKYSHILMIDEIESIAKSVEIDEDLDYEPDYQWDGGEDGYNYYSEHDSKTGKSHSDDDSYPEDDLFSDYDDNMNTEDDLDENYSGESDNTFFAALKIKIYGRIKIDLPFHYLEEFDDIEMADCDIESLDGIEHCINVVYVDLAGNRIKDISELRNLSKIEEIYLSDNDIGYIDALSSLTRLKTIDISYNDISDIYPLFDLERLEFLNIIGNEIPEEQIKKMREKGCVVMQD
jgi:Leucine-rich repeat (LRR) protein